jgi:hypothetical protein
VHVDLIRLENANTGVRIGALGFLALNFYFHFRKYAKLKAYIVCKTRHLAVGHDNRESHADWVRWQEANPERSRQFYRFVSPIFPANPPSSSLTDPIAAKIDMAGVLSK